MVENIEDRRRKEEKISVFDSQLILHFRELNGNVSKETIHIVSILFMLFFQHFFYQVFSITILGHNSRRTFSPPSPRQ